MVYKAQDPAIGRTVAIKTIRLSDLTDSSERERLRERLFREAQSAGILSHPNIVTIYDILEEDGVSYIFMELVNGPTLEALLAGETPPGREGIFNIFRQTASALDYAHKKGIVHRDIKPANIMIDDAGAAKITDFGVAKIVSQQMTQSGAMMGTPSYMSPEQIQGGSVDGRADEFALAVIAYEILTGEKPFVAEYVPSLLYKICREDPAPPQRLNPTLGPEIEVVMRRALAKTGGERYPTCAEFVSELEIACALRPNWTPFTRGMSQNMPTIASTSGAAYMEPPPAVLTPPAPAAKIPPVVVIPPRRPIEVEAPESHTVRNAVLALAALILVAAGLFAARGWISPAPTQSADTPPSQAAQTPAPQKPEAEKPSPMTASPPAPAPATDVPKQVSTTPAVPDETKVQISTAPGGAQATVDGNAELTCLTPCAMMLPRGRHTMTVKLDGYRDAQRIFEAPGEATLIIDLERGGATLSVTSLPTGAGILLNGQARTEKTPAVLKLPAGSYKLQVVKDTLKFEETIQIRDGGMYHREYTLE